MNFMQLFSCCFWLFVFVTASIPKGNLSNDPSFEEVFSHLVELLSDGEKEKIAEYPYPTGRILLTLNKYLKDEDECCLFQSPIFSYVTGIESYKYKSVVRSMKEVFYTIGTEARWKCISSWEFIINSAFSALMQNRRAMVLELMDEALIANNHLACYGLPRFSKMPELINYDTEDSDRGPVFSVSEEYENLVRETVLTELENIRNVYYTNGELTKAGVIDLCVLIHQHVRSFKFITNDADVSETLIMVFKFPEIVLDTYGIFVKYESGHRSAKDILNAVCDRITKVDPSGLAVYMNFYPFERSNLDDFRNFLNANKSRNCTFSRDLLNIYESLSEPREKDELRLYITARTRAALIEDLDRKLDFSGPLQHFFLFYARDLLKNVCEIFGDRIVLSLTGTNPLALFAGLEVRINSVFSIEPPEGIPFHPINDFETVLIIIELSTYFGMLETIKGVFCSTFSSRFNQPTICSFVIDSLTYCQFDCAEFLLEKYSNLINASWLERVMTRMAAKAPTDFFKRYYYKFQLENTSDSIVSLMNSAICSVRFSTFDFLVDRALALNLPIFNSEAPIRVELLISNAIGASLPEYKISEYIRQFGSNILNDTVCRSSFFAQAAYRGYARLLEQFGPCDYEAFYKALEAAINGEQTQIFKYLIDSAPSTKYEKSTFSLIDSMVMRKNREALQYFVEKRWGVEISVKKKYKLLDLLIQYKFLFYDDECEFLEYMLQFCRMLEWTRRKSFNLRPLPSNHESEALSRPPSITQIMNNLPDC